MRVLNVSHKDTVLLEQGVYTLRAIVQHHSYHIVVG